MDKNAQSQQLIQSKVEIKRSRRGLFTRKSLQVFVGDAAQQVIAGEEKTFTVRPGNVQVVLGRSKLRFRSRMGEGRIIEVKEGIYNWKYCLKFGFFFLTTIPLIPTFIELSPFGILNLLALLVCFVLMVYYAASEYFYLSVVK